MRILRAAVIPSMEAAGKTSLVCTPRRTRMSSDPRVTVPAIKRRTCPYSAATRLEVRYRVQLGSPSTESINDENPLRARQFVGGHGLRVRWFLFLGPAAGVLLGNLRVRKRPRVNSFAPHLRWNCVNRCDCRLLSASASSATLSAER